MRKFSFTFQVEDRLCDVETNVSARDFELCVHALTEECGFDVLIAQQDTKIFVDFHREANHLAEAIASALIQVQTAGFDIKNIEIEEV